MLTIVCRLVLDRGTVNIMSVSIVIILISPYLRDYEGAGVLPLCMAPSMARVLSVGIWSAVRDIYNPPPSEGGTLYAGPLPGAPAPCPAADPSI